jgi:hypothetical protein
VQAYDPAMGMPSLTAADHPCQVDTSLPTVPSPPAAPGGLSVPTESGGPEFAVNWDRLDVPARYELQRQYMWRYAPGQPVPTGIYSPMVSTVYTGANCSYLESPVTGSDSWFAYRVRAYSLFSGYRIYGPWSDWSVSCYASDMLPGHIGMVTVPYLPVTGDFTITVSGAWGADTYVFEEDNDRNFPNPRRIAPELVLPAPEYYKQYTVRDRADGIYYYRVRAENTHGVGPWYTVWNGVQVTGNPQVPPTTPMVLTVPEGSRNGNIQVSWTGIPGATNYVLQEDTSADFQSPLSVHSGTGTSWSGWGRTAGEYFYRVRAENSLGQGQWFAGENGCLVVITSPVLTAALAETDPGHQDIRPDAESAVVLVLGLSADADHDIRVEDLAVKVRGSADDHEDVALLRLYRDVDGDGLLDASTDELLKGSGTFPTDNGTITFAGIGRTVAAGTSEDWLVVVDFAGTASPGESFYFSVPYTTGITCTDVASGVPALFTGYPLEGGRRSVYYPSTPGELSVSLSALSPADGTVRPGEGDVVMMAFTLSAGAREDLGLSRLVLRGQGSGDEVTDLTAVVLAEDVNRDGVYTPGLDRAIGHQSAFGSDDGLCEFRDLGETVGAGSSPQWIVVFAFAEGLAPDLTFSIQIVADADLLCLGAVSGAVIVPEGLPLVGRTVTSEEATTEVTVIVEEAPGCSPAWGLGPLGSAGSALPLLLLGCALCLVRVIRRKAA